MTSRRTFLRSIFFDSIWIGQSYQKFLLSELLTWVISDDRERGLVRVFVDASVSQDAIVGMLLLILLYLIVIET